MFAHIAANGRKGFPGRHFRFEPARFATRLAAIAASHRCITPFFDAVLNRRHPKRVPVLGAGLDAARGIGMNDRNSFNAGQSLYFQLSAAGCRGRQFSQISVGVATCGPWGLPRGSRLWPRGYCAQRVLADRREPSRSAIPPGPKALQLSLLTFQGGLCKLRWRLHTEKPLAFQH